MFTWSHGKAKELDQLQTPMLGKAAFISSRPDESLLTYLQWRAKKVNKAIQLGGLWLKLWARRLMSWCLHIIERHPELWITQLLNYRSTKWLQEQKLAHNVRNGRWTIHSRRTLTRVRPGHVKQWADGVEALKGIERCNKFSV